MTERKSVANLKFETRPIEDPNATAQKGYKCYKDVDFAIIYTPGDKFNIPEQEITPERLSYWQDNPDTRYRVDAYHAWKAGREVPTNGTPLREWPVATPSEIHELNALHIRSVEDLAEMNEDACRRFGPNATRLKQKAQTWIAAGADKGKVVEKVAQQEAMMEQMLKRMDELEKAKAESDRINASMAAQLAEASAKKPAKKADAA